MCFEQASNALKNGGGRGIRTPGARLRGSHDFESRAFNQLSHPSAFIYKDNLSALNEWAYLPCPPAFSSLKLPNHSFFDRMGVWAPPRQTFRAAPQEIPLLCDGSTHILLIHEECERRYSKSEAEPEIFFRKGLHVPEERRTRTALFCRFACRKSSRVKSKTRKKRRSKERFVPRADPDRKGQIKKIGVRRESPAARARTR